MKITRMSTLSKLAAEVDSLEIDKLRTSFR